jgi:putative ABC transport system permease protein
MFQDLRLALRNFRNHPAFTCAVVLTLALGIGANTAVYGVVDGVLLHPIPFPSPDRLVAIYQKGKLSDKYSVSYPNLLSHFKARIMRLSASRPLKSAFYEIKILS